MSAHLPAGGGMSKHRLDAITDGIFAVAMTLLVIELKIPETAHITDATQLAQALAHLLPKFFGWVISFLVLALFWWGHHRAFHFVRVVDGKLVFINILFLAFVSFMPFASALSGEYGGFFLSQLVYSGNMLTISLLALWMWRYLHHNPQLCHPPMPELAWRLARLRTLMLAAISLIAVGIAWVLPSGGNMAFMLMMAAGPLSRRVEKRYRAATSDAEMAQRD